MEIPMFIFGQLILAAILCALPMTYFGLWWYIGTVIYLTIANIMTLFAWRKSKCAYLKAVEMDVNRESFRVRQGMAKVFKGDQPHVLVLGMLILYAPFTAVVLIFLIGNRFLLNRLVSRFKEKSDGTLRTRVCLLWSEDLRDNGLFRTKL